MAQSLNTAPPAPCTFCSSSTIVLPSLNSGPALAPRLLGELVRHFTVGRPACMLSASVAVFKSWSQWKFFASTANTPPPALRGLSPASRRSAVAAAATPASVVELSGTVTVAATAAEARTDESTDATSSAFMLNSLVHVAQTRDTGNQRQRVGGGMLRMILLAAFGASAGES